jgi:two-component sensor histidine kinase/PAS domain-containing protein
MRALEIRPLCSDAFVSPQVELFLRYVKSRGRADGSNQVPKRRYVQTLRRMIRRFKVHIMASASPPLNREAASTLAVVASSNEPLLFLAADLTVIAASASFCAAFQIDPTKVVGKKLAEVGAGEWSAPQIGALLKATASGVAQIEAYEIDLNRKDHPPRSLLLNARKIDAADGVGVRLLLSITDITKARAEARKMDDLIREKEILMREVQHRVANSLQIIASVLLQSARKVQSEEARSHLQDAHHRVLSIATVQRKLAQSTSGDVELAPYLTELCQSLGASMIRDPSRLSIVVNVDDSSVTANASVSIGLIVTELVINALKHAFPDHRNGVIAIDYHSQGRKWKLSVKDDGVGMPTGESNPKPGLGSGIVDALARQLRGRISLTDALPGLQFSLEGVDNDDSGLAPLKVA